MHRALVVLSVSLWACGGAAARAPKAGLPSASNEGDHGFADYAATHGIQALSGSGGDETTEVSADGLRLERADKDKTVRLDGVISEWPPLAKAKVLVRGSGARASMSVGLLYDDSKLYVGGDVADASFVAGRDHVSLVLAVPQPGGPYAIYDIGLYAGKPGESEGSVRLGKRALNGAKIVEAATTGGYTFEASVPFAALPEARSTEVGIRGVAQYVGGDVTIATGPGDALHPRSMPWVPSEPELSMIEQLLAPKGLTKTVPVAEVVADLTGDGIRERVAVYEHYLTICGTSYLAGTGFFFRDLVGELIKLEVRDVTGRGKGDIIVRRQASAGDGTREYLEVLSILDPSREPRLTFAHEIAVRQSDHRVDNSVRLGRGEIDVSTEPATRWDATSYQEPVASDVEPILLPWGAVRSQTWRWDGSRFAKAKEVAQREQGPVIGSTARAAAADESGPPARPAEPPTPRVIRGSNLSASALDAFRRDRSLGAEARPKTDLQVNVTGDERPERVVLFGRDVVVFGPGFKGGVGYAYTTLSQFADGNDVRDLSARDLTGDGAAELLVRGVRHVSSGRGPVDVEVLFVYRVDDTGSVERLFGIESGRDQATKRVQGLVQLVPAPGGKSFDIVSAPGRASGWTAKTFPWPQESPGTGAEIEPLLLPWGGVKSARYSWNGSEFVLKAD